MLLAVCPNPSIDTFIWVNSLIPGEVHRATREKRYPGGKGVHVALAAAELGEKVTLLGFWGGETGKWIRNECMKSNIHCIGPELNEWSRSCFTFKSEGSYDDTELLGSGPEISPEIYREFLNSFKEYVKKAQVITFSGSWPKGTPTNGYGQLIIEAKKTDKPVFLDATGEPFTMGLKENPYAIHLNYAESKEISILSDIRDIVKYFRRYVEMVAITAGKEGLYLGIKDEILHGNVQIDPPFYSAVGSGDCLTAGLATGVMNKMGMEEILRLGVACGAANCLREDLGMLYRRDVEKLREKVKIKKLVI